MGGKIDCYLDISSLYSYVAYVQLQKIRDLLAAHSVELEYHPVFLGGINNASGNKPPWVVPAKAVHGHLDSQRSLERVGITGTRAPKDLMTAGMTVLPLRALHYIKRTYSREIFETTMLYLFHVFWTPPNANLTVPANVAKALSEVPSGFRGSDSPGKGSQRLFSQEEVERIMHSTTTKEIKDVLSSVTKEALDKGAFGAPWFWVTNDAGASEPFFGSDRFHFIYKFLGLPYQDVALLPPGDKAKL